MTPAGRARRLLGGVAAAWALLVSCAPPGGEFDRLVLVTFDTTRADHLGAYGYPRATTPFFDALAAGGVLFERAMAPISETVPSHATMFTSLYPLEHGVGHNGQRLPEGVPTVAEILGESGYATAGFVSLELMRRSGLQRGFDSVDYRGAGRNAPGRATADAAATTAAAIDWLRRQPRHGRFFLWVHYYDPHTPYEPPPASLAALRRDSGPMARIHDLLTVEQGVRLDVYGDDPGRMLENIDLYDGELRAMDDQFRALYEAFGELGLADRSAWIVVGDHGEGLGSHSWLEHSVRIHQEQIRVPLLLHAPGAERWPVRRVEDVVELTDLLPTLLGLAGSESPAGARGRSLLPYVERQPPPASEREAFVQRRTFTRERDRERLTPPAFGEKWEAGDRLALVGRQWKYVHWTAGAPELYDLASDPGELHDLAAARPDLVEAMRERLLARARELRARRLEAEGVDDQTLEVLRSLGYLQ